MFGGNHTHYSTLSPYLSEKWCERLDRVVQQRHGICKRNPFAIVPPVRLVNFLSLFLQFYLSCRYITSALVVVTKKMNIVLMVLVVKGHIVHVWDLKQHFYNTAQAHKIRPGDF